MAACNSRRDPSRRGPLRCSTWKSRIRRPRARRPQISVPVPDAQPRCDGETVERDVVLRERRFAAGVAVEMDVAAPVTGDGPPRRGVRRIEVRDAVRVRTPRESGVARPVIAPAAASPLRPEHELVLRAERAPAHAPLDGTTERRYLTVLAT